LVMGLIDVSCVLLALIVEREEGKEAMASGRALVLIRPWVLVVAIWDH